jgi:transcriptional regulator with PAS, ATPase and Fis domain
LSVLLTGETGVGKEVLAEFIHGRSPRAQGPFLCLNCAAFPENMVESELFGHERGAFTGAMQAKPGLLEAAGGGTVLLDEVGELTLPLQAKLLRVFEARKALRVGSVTPRPIDVRFISATNRNLDRDVTAGRFRKDLYFRLRGIAIEIPPLRERLGELPQLTDTFLGQVCEQTGRRPRPELSPEARKLLERYPWPGNIRELRNAIERAVLLCTGATIKPEHLPPEVASSSNTDSDLIRIQNALAQCNGNQSRAAKLLGIARNTLIARLEAYGLARPRKH